MNLKDALLKLAPTAATLLGGPFAGMAVEALGSALGIDEPTQAKIEKAFAAGQMTGDQLAAVKLAEQQLAAKLAELDVNREEIAAADRKSARDASVSGGTHKMLFFLSILLLAGTLGTEAVVLFKGYPDTVPDIVVGRVLGLMDAVAMMVLSFWYGTTSGSHQKTELLAASSPGK